MCILTWQLTITSLVWGVKKNKKNPPSFTPVSQFVCKCRYLCE